MSATFGLIKLGIIFSHRIRQTCKNSWTPTPFWWLQPNSGRNVPPLRGASGAKSEKNKREGGRGIERVRAEFKRDESVSNHSRANQSSFGNLQDHHTWLHSLMCSTPRASLMSRLICPALTSLDSERHILIFTPKTHTFILHWNQLFNANFPRQRELCTHTSSLLPAPQFISHSDYLSFDFTLQFFVSLLAVAV